MKSIVASTKRAALERLGIDVRRGNGLHAEIGVEEDVKKLPAWMGANFIGKLQREDGAALKCTSCHGMPFRGGFLETWKE